MITKLLKRLFFRPYKALAYMPTSYALFQYMLLRPYSMEDTLFFASEKCQTNVISCFPHYYDLTIRSRFLSCKYRLNRSWNFLLIYFSCRRSECVYLTGSIIYTDLFTFFSKKCYFLEDGIASYGEKTHQVGMPKSGMRRFLYGPCFLRNGFADKVAKVYLTGILAIPDEIAGKVELINLKHLWSLRTDKEKEDVYRIFLPEGKDILSRFADKEILLVTQPLSEDFGDLFPEDEKIDMYRRLIAGIDQTKVLIKPHPRERTDYKKYFPHIAVLQTSCPLQLLTIMGMKIKKAITVNSTAVYNLDDSVEKIVVGKNASALLYERCPVLFRVE